MGKNRGVPGIYRYFNHVFVFSDDVERTKLDGHGEPARPGLVNSCR